MLTNNSIIEDKFNKASLTYHDSSFIQREMALELILLLDLFKIKPYFVLELGAGSGNLTSLLIKNKYIKELVVNDLSLKMLEQCQKRITYLKPKFAVTYSKGDFLKLTYKTQFDLIISNAVLQWCNDLIHVFRYLKNYLVPGGYLVFSTFGVNHFIEFKKLLGITLNYQSKEYFEINLKNLGFSCKVIEKQFKLHFDSIKELLVYLKQTGVTAVTSPMSVPKLKHFMKVYSAQYTDKKGVYVSWHCIFVVAEQLPPIMKVNNEEEEPHLLNL